MRVLQVVNRLAPGGIEVLLLRALPHLQQAGVEVDVCCLGGPHTLDDQFLAAGCHVHRMRKSPNCYATAREFHRILDGKAYHVVHSNFGYTSGGLSLGAARAKTPVIVSVHSSEPLTLMRWRSKPVLRAVRNRWLAWHRRLMDRYVSRFLCHSHANQAGFTRHGIYADERTRVIHNGVDGPRAALPSKHDARRTIGLADAERVVAHIGSFRAEKNHAGALEIFQRLRQNNPATTLVFVGDGPLRPSVAEQARRLGVDGAVRFAGLQSDVWRYLAAADLFLFPSTSEGFGNALVESALAGTPIVASDIAAHRESVAPAQHPFLFRLPDYEQAAQLAEEQLRVAASGSAAWVDASRRHAEQMFSMRGYAARLVETYQQVTLKAA